MVTLTVALRVWLWSASNCHCDSNTLSQEIPVTGQIVVSSDIPPLLMGGVGLRQGLGMVFCRKFLSGILAGSQFWLEVEQPSLCCLGPHLLDSCFPWGK